MGFLWDHEASFRLLFYAFLSNLQSQRESADSRAIQQQLEPEIRTMAPTHKLCGSLENSGYRIYGHRGKGSIPTHLNFPMASFASYSVEMKIHGPQIY